MSFASNRALRRAGRIALAVLLCSIVAVSLPAVQLRIARAVLSRLDGVDLDVDYLWAGPRGVTAEHVRVASPGLVANVERVAVRVAVWSSLTQLSLDIEQIQLRGVEVGVSPQPSDSSVPPPAVREPFEGVARVAKIPKWIRVRALSADGSIDVRTATDVEIAAPWRVSLEALGAGGTASLRLDASPETRRAGSPVAASTLEASASATIAADGRVTRLALDGAFKPLDRDGEIRLAAEAELAADTERYRVDIDSPKARLAHAEASFAPRVSLVGGFEVNVTEGVVAAFARGRSTADLSGAANGTLHADLVRRHADIKASLRAHGSGWEALDPRLADLGSLELAADVDTDLDRDELSVRMAEAVLRSAAQGEVLRVAALQPLRFGVRAGSSSPIGPWSPRCGSP